LPLLEKPRAVDKFILLSVIIASIVIPVRAARIKNPRAGLRSALKRAALFNAFYLFLLLYMWGRF
jgi:hypothetical protein